MNDIKVGDTVIVTTRKAKGKHALVKEIHAGRIDVDIEWYGTVLRQCLFDGDYIKFNKRED